MISSMTGFGRGESSAYGVSVNVEARSLNNRFLEVWVKLPRKFISFEEELVKISKDTFSRGKVDFTIIIDGINESMQELEVNTLAVDQYISAFKKIEKKIGSDFGFKAENLLQYDDIFVWSIPEGSKDKIRKLVVKNFKKAVSELKKHRTEEGKNLAKDFAERLKRISQLIVIIRQLVEERHLEDYEKLKQRLLKVLNDVEKIESERTAIEAAYMAEKFDISEECVRLESHIKLFNNAMKRGGVVGRKLDFILQEMNREANTISSKSNNFTISKEVVEIKEEIDRIKEQVRNVE